METIAFSSNFYNLVLTYCHIPIGEQVYTKSPPAAAAAAIQGCFAPAPSLDSKAK